jgi:quercetin dioxygenase-like cupin family protein
MTALAFSFQSLIRRPGTRSETLANPVTGDRLTLLQSVPRDGAPLVFRTDLPPHAAGSPLHVHQLMDECFEVVAGTLEMEIGGAGQWRTLRAGDRVDVLAGTPHSFRNASDEWTSFVSTTTRGLEFERFLLSMFALAAEGRTNAAGMPRNPMHLALLLHYADLTVPGVHRGIQRAIIASLAGLARMMGVERHLQRHWHNERAGRLA